MIRAFLFDFDGTIADTLPEIYRIVRSLSREFGYENLSDKEAETLRNLTILEMLKKVKLPLWKFPLLVKRVKGELAKDMGRIPLHKGMGEVLRQLHNEGFVIGIVTSSKKDLVSTFLKAHDMNLFDFIYSGSSIFGKERKIRKAIQQNKLSLRECVYVGDEIRDINAAKKLSLPIAAVTWGFNTKESLTAHQPNFLIDTPSELLDIAGKKKI